ncbi:nucleoside deaminase [Glutamicibacter sp. 287]|uniref:nucleoside deaminase n=1 Tax=unclassified Glutamicibacter TaxID=2627139 RepID=UPI000BB8FBBA|nr:nucleoside deaminase [Glutamicibacter sp. BW80]PCC28556.1 tRNA-specific adenosine deaminase [Glutamicibacter sp. BW80]
MDERFFDEAVALSRQGMQANQGGPFGAVIVLDGAVIATGNNMVLGMNDPTAHAEVIAIRNAGAKLKSFDLSECELYTSCEPCPMCLGAIYWSRFKHVYYANTRQDAARIGFDDELIYTELDKPMGQRLIPFTHVPSTDAASVFAEWADKVDKTRY